jgi:hypothetical protein
VIYYIINRICGSFLRGKSRSFHLLHAVRPDTHGLEGVPSKLREVLAPPATPRTPAYGTRDRLQHSTVFILGADIDRAPQISRAQLHLHQHLPFVVVSAGDDWQLAYQPTAQSSAPQPPIAPTTRTFVVGCQAKSCSCLHPHHLPLRAITVAPIPLVGIKLPAQVSSSSHTHTTFGWR